MLRILFFWVSFLGLAAPALAQREYTNWCFGYDTIPDPATTQTFYTKFGHGAQVKFEAAGPHTVGLCWASNNSIADAQGNLQFYTNGDNIYDRRHQLMPGGAGLADATDAYCDSGALTGAALNNVILPAPGQPGLYYVCYFRRDPASPVSYIGRKPQLLYCLVDMRTGGGFGTVVRRDVVIATTNNSTYLVAVRHRNGRDFWLLTRELASRTFLAYLLTPGGLAAAPVVSPTPEDSPYPKGGMFGFRSSADGKQLICSGGRQVMVDAHQFRMEAACALYGFNSESGLVSDERIIHTTPESIQPALNPDVGKDICGNGSIYFAACFSPAGNVLYTIEYKIGVAYQTSLCQYDLTQPTPAAIGASRLVLAEQVLTNPITLDKGGQGRFADVQLAPDGTVWVGDLQQLNNLRSPTAAVDVQPKAIDIIRHPNVVGPGCQLELEAYPLPGRASPAQFPNVVANMLYPATALEAEVSCTDSARFWPNSAQTSPPGRWNFGEPGSGLANEATGYYVAHHYAHGGTYQVTLTYADGRKLARTLEVPAGPADLSNANIFTPNGDGLNDTFQLIPHGALTSDATLRVFSRWGRLVYEATNSSPAWDGLGASAGQYTYQLEYLDCQGQTQHQRGWVELIR